MGLLWTALPMLGCAAMMALMMRMMSGGGRDPSGGAPEPSKKTRGDALEVELSELRARLGGRDADAS